MESIDYTKYLMLSLLVIAWCVLHSAMISVSVIEYFKKRLGSKFRFYRLFFNLIVFLTLIPVALFAYSVRAQTIFHWDGYMRIGQVLLLVVAVLLFFLGGRHYNVRQVLGIKQIKEGTLNKAISDREAAFAGSASLMVGISIFIITLIKMVITKVLNTPHSKKGAFCLLSAVAGSS